MAAPWSNGPLQVRHQWNKGSGWIHSTPYCESGIGTSHEEFGPSLIKCELSDKWLL